MSDVRPPAPGDALRLHLNENTGGCAPAVLAALAAVSRQDVGRYPDTAEATARVERWFDLEPGWALVTNGLDEGIQIVAQCGVCHYRGTSRQPASATIVGGQAEVLIVDPAFEVYAVCADAVGARRVHIPPDTGFSFPLARLLAAITPATRVVYLTDPNNPTGQGIPAGAVERIAAAAPQALVLVDEAYADFSGRTLMGPLLDRSRNVVVGRTFAKAHGLAALRVGALVAHPETLDLLRPMQLPFSVNVYATRALSVALEDRAYLEGYVREAALSRELIYGFCRRRGLVFWPSEANFVLFRVGGDAAAIAHALRDRHILVRDQSRSPGCAGCLRLTAGLVDDTAVALSNLEEILASRTN